ncbi:hypothetical protein [Nocardia gipuzkoensis]
MQHPQIGGHDVIADGERDCQVVYIGTGAACPTGSCIAPGSLSMKNPAFAHLTGTPHAFFMGIKSSR